MGRDVGKRPTAVGHAPWRRPRYRRRRMLKQAMAHDLAWPGASDNHLSHGAVGPRRSARKSMKARTLAGR